MNASQPPCLHELFSEQADRTPEAVAVVSASQQLTYGQLNTSSDLMARHLRTLGVGPEVIVGVHLDRGVGTVVGLLGILKAGGAYAPLDPGHPPERLRYLLLDSNPAAVLTQERMAGILPPTRAVLVKIDCEWE